jgi:hypothetical protein
MARTARLFHCAPESVFAVLADGWTYPAWVVGASRMRDVDETWPEPGSRLAHSVGLWPGVLDGTTSVVEWEPPRRAVLTARGWPAGEARVIIEVREHVAGCVVRITEYPVRGPGTLVPRLLAEPAIQVRNRETLLRLAFVAESRGGGGRTT